MSQPTSRASIIAAVSVIAVVAIVLAVFVGSVFRGKERREAERKAVVYVVDEVKSETQLSRTRWFVECRDRASDDASARRRDAWITQYQSTVLRKGDPCPRGIGDKPRR